MYKKNPCIELVNLIIVLLFLIFFKISFIKYIIIIFLFFYRKTEYNLVLLLIGTLSLFRPRIGNFINLLLLFEYLYYMIKKYTMRDIIDIIIYITRRNPQKLWIKVLYFPSYFKINYNKLSYISKELGYSKKWKLVLFKVRYSIKETIENLDQLTNLFEKRHFYNKYKNVNITKVTKKDALNTLINMIILIFIILYGGKIYAFFN